MTIKLDREQQRVLKGQGYVVQIDPVLAGPPKLTYYTTDRGTGEVKSMLLPADPYSLQRYLRKGFTLEPPQEPSAPYKCDICGKEVKTALALAGHKRSHK